MTATLGVPRSIADQVRIDDRRRRFAYMQIAFLSIVVGAMAYLSPTPFSIAFLVLVCTTVVVVMRPIVGIFAVVFFTMIGDTVTIGWYPFAKNFSSRESILFISDGIPINPLEVILIATTAAWLGRIIGGAEWSLVRGRLYRPLMVFAAFVALGLIYGIARGGNTTVALWEARPMLYIPLLYVLITNLFTSARHYEVLFLVAIAGIAVQSVLALDYYSGLAAEQRTTLESLTEHSAAIHLNVVLLSVIALFLIPRSPAHHRLLVALAAVPVAWSWVLSQRRAAAIAMCVGLVLLAIALIVKNRRAAWWFIPIALVVGTAYTVAFWNSTQGIGFGAQAIKSVIASDAVTVEDRSSDLYRDLEAFDVWYTIRSNQIFGIGFGKQFLRPIPLPPITDFLFAPYMPHNSILWVWMKMGFIGFVSMLFVVVRSVQHGVRTLTRTQTAAQSLVVFGALSYIVMYMVFVYVDIAWDSRSTVFLAVAFAICADLDAVVAPREVSVVSSAAVPTATPTHM